MNKSKVIAIAVGIVLLFFVGFQNCAKVKMKEPSLSDINVSGQAFEACINGMTKPCSDSTGSGVRCVEPRAGVPDLCIYESCKPGYRLQSFQCVPVSCSPGTIANCIVPFGEVRMTCTSNGSGFGACTAHSCLTGYVKFAGLCIPAEDETSGDATPTPTASPASSATPSSTPEDSPTPTPSPTPGATLLCEPGSHRSCDTNSTYGAQTCNEDGTDYGSCEQSGCKPGYNEQSGSCVANTCDANTVSPCESGSGDGFQTCNSQGSAWGVCVLNSCDSGYSLIDGVCVERTCSPGETRTCEFDHGVGLKTCNNTGTAYGTCEFVACVKGHQEVGGVCMEEQCTPESTASCREDSGSGEMVCHKNGQGYGPCQITTCDQGFLLKNGKCQSENYCEANEKFECTLSHGKGLRNCDNHAKGPCVATECDAGYELSNEDNKAVCKPVKKTK